MPVSGEIIEFNEGLEADPEAVNKDAYGEGWIVKIKIKFYIDILISSSLLFY